MPVRVRSALPFFNKGKLMKTITTLAIALSAIMLYACSEPQEEVVIVEEAEQSQLESTEQVDETETTDETSEDSVILPPVIQPVY
jgi:PBP1b-binding outer membrane lipoprotein LpoB